MSGPAQLGTHLVLPAAMVDLPVKHTGRPVMVLISWHPAAYEKPKLGMNLSHVDDLSINSVSLLFPSPTPLLPLLGVQPLGLWKCDFATQPAACGQSCTLVLAVTHRWPATELVKEITVHSEAALRAMSEACQPQASLLAKQKEMLQARLDYTGQVTQMDTTTKNKVTQVWPVGVAHHVILHRSR